MQHHYDRKTTTMFEVIGSYFVNYYYNKLYIMAHNRNKLKDNSTSLTDEYKAAVKTYSWGIKHNQEYYSRTIKGIHEHYQHYTKYATISLVDFIDNVLECFVPVEYFKDLTEKNKEFFIRKIVVDSVVEMMSHILTFKTLSEIIDNHKDRENVRALQNRMSEIFSDIREQIYNQFTRQLTGKKEVETVDIGVVQKFKALLEQTTKEKIDGQIKIEQMQKMIIALSKQAELLKQTINMRDEEIKQLKGGDGKATADKTNADKANADKVTAATTATPIVDKPADKVTVATTATPVAKAPTDEAAAEIPSIKPTLISEPTQVIDTDDPFATQAKPKRRRERRHVDEPTAPAEPAVAEPVTMELAPAVAEPTPGDLNAIIASSGDDSDDSDNDSDNDSGNDSDDYNSGNGSGNDSDDDAEFDLTQQQALLAQRLQNKAPRVQEVH